ncbi:MAG: hypothetical protein JRI76_14285 [Deltaproteobacteria bacterium]|nr:hypothetical protein [Deltaproteobacteria bacterium]
MENGSIFEVSPAVKEAVDGASRTPCILCEGETEWVYSFEPQDPAAFPGLRPGDAVYCGLCDQCLSGRNHDPEGFRDFIEGFLSKLGIRKELREDPAE